MFVALTGSALILDANVCSVSYGLWLYTAVVVAVAVAVAVVVVVFVAVAVDTIFVVATDLAAATIFAVATNKPLLSNETHVLSNWYCWENGHERRQ